MITEDDVIVEVAISPWVSVNKDGVKFLGLWMFHDGLLHLDYSMLYLIGTNKPIKCMKHEIKKVVADLLNHQLKLDVSRTEQIQGQERTDGVQ